MVAWLLVRQLRKALVESIHLRLKLARREVLPAAQSDRVASQSSESLGERPPLGGLVALKRRGSECGIEWSYVSHGMFVKNLLPRCVAFRSVSLLSSIPPIQEGIEVVFVLSGFRDLPDVFQYE